MQKYSCKNAAAWDCVTWSLPKTDNMGQNLPTVVIVILLELKAKKSSKK